MSKNKIIILTGPTGVGKTDLSIELAKALNTEIISADSMQIYRYMDIGTGKIKDKEKQGIVHHMIDIINPDCEYTVDDYKKESLSLIDKINNENKIPIVVGGTGLYIDSLIYKLKFNIAPPNKHLREYYEKINEKYGNQFLHDILNKVDPLSAKRIHPNQTVRIIRALEVYDQTLKPFSSFNDYEREYRDDIEFKYIVLNRPREELYERINKRVDGMLEEGLVEEVSSLLNAGYTRDLTSMQAIGYKEIISHLYYECSLEEAVELLKRNSRRYAKRQLTWFRREKSKTDLNISVDDTSEILRNCLNIIKGE